MNQINKTNKIEAQFDDISFESDRAKLAASRMEQVLNIPSNLVLEHHVNPTEHNLVEGIRYSEVRSDEPGVPVESRYIQLNTHGLVAQQVTDLHAALDEKIRAETSGAVDKVFTPGVTGHMGQYINEHDKRIYVNIDKLSDMIDIGAKVDCSDLATEYKKHADNNITLLTQAQQAAQSVTDKLIFNAQIHNSDFVISAELPQINTGKTALSKYSQLINDFAIKTGLDPEVSLRHRTTSGDDLNQLQIRTESVEKLNEITEKLSHYAPAFYDLVETINTIAEEHPRRQPESKIKAHQIKSNHPQNEHAKS